MTSQEVIEQQVRMVIGDMHVQLIMARARIAELEQQLSEKKISDKANGHDTRSIEPELSLGGSPL